MRSWTILVAWGLVGFAVAGTAGCGSYWDLPKGEELPYGCADQILWFPDDDGDKFGRPDENPIESCEAPAGAYASNQLDCDDTAFEISGRVGTICPEEIGAGYVLDEVTDQVTYLEAPSTCFHAAVSQNVEYLGTCGTVRLRFTEASSSCQHWAGWPADETRGLAWPEWQNNEVEPVLSQLSSGVTDFALWVDVRWTPGAGDPLTDGTWEVPPAPTYAFCGGTAPTPADFWPDVNFNDPDARAGAEETLPDLRLALVPDGNGWCLGLPPGSPREAFPLCQRPRPDGGAYQERVAASE